MMTIEIIQGDITKLHVDIIVNAANTSLLGGGGVDGAIHREGGPEILEDCRKIRNRQGSCAVGEAVVTTAGNLSAAYVIHTVGPKWNNGVSNEAEKLENCYINSLKLAEELGVKSIAFPNISTGIYGYPKQAAAEIAVKVVKEYSSSLLDRVVFVCFDEANFTLYQKLLE